MSTHTLYIDPTSDIVTNIDYVENGTNHYGTVDDGDSNDDTNSIYTLNISKEYDLYGHSYSSNPDGRITNVSIVLRARWNKDTADTDHIGVAWRITGSGTVRTYVPSIDISASYTDYTLSITDQTGAPTTWSDIHDLQFGPYFMANLMNAVGISKVRLKVTWEDYESTSIIGKVEAYIRRLRG